MSDATTTYATPVQDTKLAADLVVGDVVFAGHFLGTDRITEPSGYVRRGHWVRIVEASPDGLEDYLVELFIFDPYSNRFRQTWWNDEHVPFRPAVSLAKPTPPEPKSWQEAASIGWSEHEYNRYRTTGTKPARDTWDEW
jgi:hypothetical protein